MYKQLSKGRHKAGSPPSINSRQILSASDNVSTGGEGTLRLEAEYSVARFSMQYTQSIYWTFRSGEGLRVTAASISRNDCGDFRESLSKESFRC